MTQFDRLPALPIIANDPFFSIWLPADLPTEANTTHWAGESKPIIGTMTVDGKKACWLGKIDGIPAANITALMVTPTQTRYTAEFEGVALQVSFWSPALPDDLDALSTPITFVDYLYASADGDEHDVSVALEVSFRLCWNGETPKPLHKAVFPSGRLNICCAGQINQNMLGQSGDHITIDWGYLYLASDKAVSFDEDFAKAEWNLKANVSVQKSFLQIGYDAIADINYFGVPCRSWYARSGKGLPDTGFDTGKYVQSWCARGSKGLLDAMREFADRHDALLEACVRLDSKVLDDAGNTAGDDYQKITAAAWRHTFAAHKLIATPEGKMALLSKENDSNGCIGTVDVSYPSIPIMLRYCPELVNALCRPVLEFAQMPVWSDKDFAPHDVGRYPHAIGQVYALKKHEENGVVYPPYYLYAAESDVYTLHNQMPVEESGNMLIMLEAAISFGADDALARQYLDTLRKWVRYLDEYGEDPGEQLCTDDFAGHLARNINLSAKALIGVACFARLLKRFGEVEESEKWAARAQAMAKSWLERAKGENGTALTFDGKGWSMKYNLVWDRVLKLGLLPEDFYRAETESYLPKMNAYGLPLDSRADYTKSDWICWTAALAPDQDVCAALLRPVAEYLKQTKTRVAFSDWYDTKTGDYVHFIGRSVQGGVFMPMLTHLYK